MKQSDKLKICNWTLLIFSALILISGIQLEATGSRGIMSVWVHALIGLIFSGLVMLHVYLHFKWKNWFSLFNKIKSPVTRILWYAFILTFVLGIAAWKRWIVEGQHSVLGGVHGKIGFLLMAIAICHIIKRIKFFKSRTKRCTQKH